jgi:D-threonate/D-erythronate kinase
MRDPMGDAREPDQPAHTTRDASRRYALIADDLTGALDAGAGFAAAGQRVTLPFSGLPDDAPDADVILVNTDSRDDTASAAAANTRRSAEQLLAAGIGRVYKKIDSVLRGHPGPEIAAVLDVYRGRALVAPAFPAQGRITRDGIQYVLGEPAAPYGGFIRDALGVAASRCDIRDADTDDDLRRIAREAAANPAYRVWCGTAGLAKQVPEALDLGRRHDLPRLPAAERVVVIAGTSHPVTVAQMATLLAHGWTHIRLDVRPGGAPPNLDALRAAFERCLATGKVLVTTFGELSKAETAALQRDPGGTRDRVIAALRQAAGALPLATGTGLILTGGDTALHVCRALGARVIRVVAEAQPGIPLGLLELPGGILPIATKSGGFGSPDSLRRTAETMLARR